MSFARIGGVFNNLINQYKIIAENRYGLIGFWIVFFFLVVALFAPWLAPHPPWEMLFANDGSLASLRPPSAEFPAGTTHLGYDLLSQLILATRTTVMIGLISGVISIVIGANVGLIAGYFGGLVDEVLMRITDILYGMPFLPFCDRFDFTFRATNRVRHPRYCINRMANFRESYSCTNDLN
jgi:peptide/nickel transport system permease protein